jgi:hypothetical protein
MVPDDADDADDADANPQAVMDGSINRVYRACGAAGGQLAHTQACWERPARKNNAVSGKWFRGNGSAARGALFVIAL